MIDQTSRPTQKLSMPPARVSYAVRVVLALLLRAVCEDATEVLTGLIVHDTATGTELVFELLRRDAPCAAAVVESFCARMHPDSRRGCERTVAAHLLATGHLAGPDLAAARSEDASGVRLEHLRCACMPRMSVSSLCSTVTSGRPAPIGVCTPWRPCWHSWPGAVVETAKPF